METQTFDQIQHNIQQFRTNLETQISQREQELNKYERELKQMRVQLRQIASFASPGDVHKTARIRTNKKMLGALRHRQTVITPRDWGAIYTNLPDRFTTAELRQVAIEASPANVSGHLQSWLKSDKIHKLGRGVWEKTKQ